MGWSNNHPNGLIHYNPQQTYRGYTLVTNLNGQESRLIDMKGRICHRWRSDLGISYSYLLPNGNLLLRTGPAGQEVSFLQHPATELLPRGGRTVSGAILELDWDGNVVWEYRYPLLHHDFERLPNGNTLVLAWELIPEEISQQVKGWHAGGRRAGDHAGRRRGVRMDLDHLNRSQGEIYICRAERVGLGIAINSSAFACSTVRQRRLTSSCRWVSPVKKLPTFSRTAARVPRHWLAVLPGAPSPRWPHRR